jgi:hypothetical protein
MTVIVSVITEAQGKHGNGHTQEAFEADNVEEEGI